MNDSPDVRLVHVVGIGRRQNAAATSKEPRPHGGFFIRGQSFMVKAHGIIPRIFGKQPRHALRTEARPAKHDERSFQCRGSTEDGFVLCIRTPHFMANVRARLFIKTYVFHIGIYASITQIRRYTRKKLRILGNKNGKRLAQGISPSALAFSCGMRYTWSHHEVGRTTA